MTKCTHCLWKLVKHFFMIYHRVHLKSHFLLVTQVSTPANGYPILRGLLFLCSWHLKLNIIIWTVTVRSLSSRRSVTVSLTNKTHVLYQQIKKRKHNMYSLKDINVFRQRGASKNLNINSNMIATFKKPLRLNYKLK